MSELYMISVACPRCLWKPALRAYPAQVAASQLHAPDKPLLSYQCQNDGCGHIYPIAADAFQRASRAPPRRIKQPKRRAA